MENLQTAYNVNVWTDDFIIPKTIDLKSVINHPCSPFFLMELRLQQFVQYLPENGDLIVEVPQGPFIMKPFYLPSKAMIDEDSTADDSICEILSSVGVPLFRMLPIIRQISSFARTMMSQPANVGRTLLPVVVGIEVNTWDPRDAAVA